MVVVAVVVAAVAAAVAAAVRLIDLTFDMASSHFCH